MVSGVYYRFCFTAINYVGESDCSPVLNVQIGDYPDPPPKPPKHISSSTTSISFDWESHLYAGGGIVDTYYIWMNGVEIDSVSSSTFTYTVSTGLVAGNSYDFAI